MAESRVNTEPGYATDIYSLDDLFGLADTEFVVDLIGSGDDMASNLAQRGLRDMQRRVPEGDLYKLIRNIGGDATPEEFRMGPLGIYNESATPFVAGPVFEGSRGPIQALPRGILVGQNARKGVLRHELEHAGIHSLANPLRADMEQAGGVYPYETPNTPQNDLTDLIESRVLQKRAFYPNALDHFMIESMQASQLLKNGEEVSEPYLESRKAFYPIGAFLNNPTDENREAAYETIQQILDLPPDEIQYAPYDVKTIYKTAETLAARRGALRRDLPLNQEILPYQILGSLQQAIMDYNMPPERKYSTKVYEDGGIVTIPVDREPRPADQRNEAFGAKLLKLAGLATTPRQLAGKVDPMVYRQVDEVLGRKPSFKESDGGIGSMKQY